MHPDNDDNGTEKTLIDFIGKYTQDTDPIRPGIVHRLDKNTSGVVIVATDENVKARLQTQFKKRLVKKHYIAAVKGTVEPPKARIDLPIGRHPKNPLKRAVRANSKDALTQYGVIEHRDAMTLLDVYPETGRTHQIRVHLSYIGHPVIGDELYGTSQTNLNRHFLHAKDITLQHPGSDEEVSYTSELAQELKDFWYNQA